MQIHGMKVHGNRPQVEAQLLLEAMHRLDAALDCLGRETVGACIGRVHVTSARHYLDQAYEILTSMPRPDADAKEVRT